MTRARQAVAASNLGDAVPASTMGEVLSAAIEALTDAGCESARLDAELLLADTLAVDRAALLAHPDRALSAAAARSMRERVARRARREPVAYILGRKGFRRIEVAVDPRVLIPRPETELLVEVALELPSGARVHEVGTGSGAVALAVKDERPDLRVSGSDASAAAIEVARANAARLGLEVGLSVARGLAFEGAASGLGCELVVANLPYVREDEWPALQPEIREYEPRDALVAGPDGLEAIRALVAGAPSGTGLALEHSPAQAAAVRALLAGAETRPDLAGRERVTIGAVR